MNVSQPSRLATWLLQRWGSGPKPEALTGDLIEQYQRGRSHAWYWRQVLRAILVGAIQDLRDHKLVAVRSLAICWTALFFLSSFTEALRRWQFDWTQTPWRSEILRQMWVYYRAPWAIITCAGCAVIGWMIVRLHRRNSAAMVILCAMSQLPWAVWWGWEISRMLWAGLWPFWDFRFALLFQAGLLFIGYPTCILLGGLWSTPQAEGQMKLQT
jgi:hypothetical protein